MPVRLFHLIVIRQFLDRYIEVLSNNKDNIFTKRLIVLLKASLRQSGLSSVNSNNKHSLADDSDIEHSIVDTIVSKNQTITPEVIQFARRSKIDFEDVRLNIYKFPEAAITFGSDVIRTNRNKCYWYKSRKHFMYKTIPFDQDLYAYDPKDKSVLLSTLKLDGVRLNKVVSLVGALDFSWGHFIVEYLPKLKLLRDYCCDEKITIVISDRLDKNCKEMVDFIKPSHWDVYELKAGQSLVCENLFYIDSTSWITDHSESLILGDSMLYQIALDALKEFSVNFTKESIIRGRRSKRIYLRRAGNFRALSNCAEVDFLLDRYDFEVVYGDKLTLSQKAKLFDQAEIIVGPGGSGFSNIIFCRKDTKVITFCNKNRVWDTYLPTMADAFALNLKFLLSNEEDDIDDPHTSYGIDVALLEKEIISSLKLK
jgi:hypothetical protein